MAEEKKSDKPVLARGIVARGKTVQVQTGERTIVGRHPETNEVVYGSKCRDAGPGEEVTLPEAELKQLREMGFIYDPTKVAPPPAEGAHMSEST